MYSKKYLDRNCQAAHHPRSPSFDFCFPPSPAASANQKRIISMKNLMFLVAPVAAMAAIFTPTSGVLAASATLLSGVVQTGGTTAIRPLANVHVTLFEATTAQPTALGQATTDASGQFL